MKRTLTVLALLAAAATAAAGTLNFSWVNATLNSDGSAIPASGPGSLTSTVVEYGPCTAAKDALASVTGTITTAEPALKNTSPSLPPGVWCARAYHTNTYGVQGDWSDIQVQVIAAPKPGKPTGFTWG